MQRSFLPICDFGKKRGRNNPKPDRRSQPLHIPQIQNGPKRQCNRTHLRPLGLTLQFRNAL